MSGLSVKNIQVLKSRYRIFFPLYFSLINLRKKLNFLWVKVCWTKTLLMFQSRCMHPYLTSKLHQQMFYNNNGANGPRYAVTQLSFYSFKPPILLLWFTFTNLLVSGLIRQLCEEESVVHHLPSTNWQTDEVSDLLVSKHLAAERVKGRNSQEEVVEGWRLFVGQPGTASPWLPGPKACGIFELTPKISSVANTVSMKPKLSC